MCRNFADKHFCFCIILFISVAVICFLFQKYIHNYQIIKFCIFKFNKYNKGFVIFVQNPLIRI